MPRKQTPHTEAYNEVFPTVLRSLMERRNVTQYRLANIVGKTRQTVSYYCDGSSSPDWKTIVKIADFFGVSTDYLLGKTDVQIPSAEFQAVVSYTGLSADNVASLNTMKGAADDNGPFVYNAKREVKGNQPYLDFANDLLDSLYENREALIAWYYLLRSVRGQISDFDIEYCNQFDETALEHGCTMLPTNVAVRLYCTRIGNAIERFFYKKYIESDCDNTTTPKQKGD